MRIIKTACGLCVNSCGLDVYVEGGKIVRVDGMAEHPYNKGQICPRGEALLEWEYSPSRLLYPMERANGDWKRITWDCALDTIATKLQDYKEKYGARSVVIQLGSIGTELFETSAFTQRFRGAYGTPNFMDPGLCFYDILRSRRLTFGRVFVEQIEGSRCILLWAHDPDGSNHAKAREIREALKRGAQLITINPKRIPLAEEGAVHIQPRPGTDLAIALALMNVIILEGLYDKEFVARWCTGFDKLAEHVREYTPERVSQISWVPAEDIRKVACVFATTRPACICQGTAALGQQRTGFQNSRALCILQAITGNLGIRGSWVKVPIPYFTDLRLPLEEKEIGYDKYPLYHSLWGRDFQLGQGLDLPEAMSGGVPYPIKALILVGGNPVTSIPEKSNFAAALKKLDFFVVIDVHMTETAQLANLALPAATFLEKVGLGYTYAVEQCIPYLMLRPKVIEPRGECWSEIKLWRQLAKRMGYGQYFPWETDEAAMQYLLKDGGVTYEQLCEHPSGMFFGNMVYGERAFTEGIATPSKKIELYSETMESLGYDPIPVFEEPSLSPVRTPELAKEYPLILITGARVPEYSHSQMRDIPRLYNKVPEPIAEVNPDTVKGLGLQDGDIVTVETPKGSATMRLRTTESMLPKIVSIPHGWEGQANANLLSDAEYREPVLGLPEFQALLCRIRKR